jgi:hypothetical protein
VGPGCGACEQHLKAIDAFAQEHPDVRVIAVSSWDPRGENDRLLASLDLRHIEVGVDPLGRMATAMYGDVQPVLTPPIPYSVLMAGDGTIRGRVDGVWSDEDATTLGII